VKPIFAHFQPDGEGTMLYRVWNVVNRSPDAEGKETRRLLFSVCSPGEAFTAIRLLRARRSEDPTVRTSEYGLEVFAAGRWTEWRDRRGRNVMESFRSLLVKTGA
jgi:hypothetical protein